LKGNQTYKTMASMEQAFDMVEQLTQELVDKEQRIMELEKQVDKYKSLTTSKQKDEYLTSLKY